MNVAMVSDYGDRCHTQQALNVEHVNEEMIRKTAYSDSGYAIYDEDSEYFDEKNVEGQVIALFSR